METRFQTSCSGSVVLHVIYSISKDRMGNSADPYQTAPNRYIVSKPPQDKTSKVCLAKS